MTVQIRDVHRGRNCVDTEMEGLRELLLDTVSHVLWLTSGADNLSGNRDPPWPPP